ncbi:GNAT family N-acetyltransferase [uncultured Roseibium sp.]|uniref:GNAT family N-acetyltransferase n=1 Tax=uncultured Roseibium sp. TaxID=1936171 RepID=UPI00374D07AE
MPLVDPAVARRILGANPFVPFLHDQGKNVLVATYGDTPAGIGASENLDNHISDIWVSPAFEGKGVGSALIGAAEQAIRGRGYLEASIHVAADNKRALGLYTHLGFAEQWRRQEFDPILNTALAKVRLIKRLG